VFALEAIFGYRLGGVAHLGRGARDGLHDGLDLALQAAGECQELVLRRSSLIRLRSSDACSSANIAATRYVRLACCL
jgi:hypothetical protein